MAAPGRVETRRTGEPGRTNDFSDAFARFVPRAPTYPSASWAPVTGASPWQDTWESSAIR